MGHPDFRVGGRVFATLNYPAAGWGMIKLSPEQQELFVRTEPTAFVPVNGAWGRKGCTNVKLRFAKRAAVQEALQLAWEGGAMTSKRAPTRQSQLNMKAPAGAKPEAQVRRFIAKFEPRHQALIRAVRRALRKQFPTAYELAYDNYNFFVLGYGPTERPSDCVVSMAAGANGVGLCFIQGAHLPDPDGLLLGSGNQTRFIRLESASVLARPPVRALIAAAVARSDLPFRRTGRGTLIIRSVAAKQRPRRKPRAA